MKLKTQLALLLLCMLLDTSCIYAYALCESNVNKDKVDIIEGDEHYVVTIATLNIREKNTTKSQVLGKLRAGDVIPVLGFTGDWARIEYKGKTAYVSSRYLEKVVTKENYVEEFDRNTTSVVNDRNGMSSVTNVSDHGRYSADTASGDVEYSSVNLYMLPSFKEGEKITFGISIELSGFNSAHLETGINSNFTKSNQISWHNAIGYSLGLHQDSNTCLALVIPLGVDLRLGSKGEFVNNKLKIEDKLYCDFSFAPRIKAKFGQFTLSAGYYMFAPAFRFSEGNLSHHAIFSLGYVWGEY